LEGDEGHYNLIALRPDMRDGADTGKQGVMEEKYFGQYRGNTMSDKARAIS